MALETASSVRAKINHPVIDADGHWREFPEVVTGQLRRIGGEPAAEGFGYFVNLRRGDERSDLERRKKRHPQRLWWASPASTLDRATAVLPRLMYERLDEMGLDFLALYPSYGLSLPFVPQDLPRQAACRAYNTYLAEEFGPFADRITPATVIPMFTPAEAIAELEHVHQLGLKVVILGSMFRRPMPDSRDGYWYEMLGLDSAYDYDPVWAKLEELGLAPTFHTPSGGTPLRASPTNSLYNFMGNFADAGEAVCKALFMGGVTRRFPKLQFAFLEGGAGWACNLYNNLIGFWKKRNPQTLELSKPQALDREQFLALAQRYGSAAWHEYMRPGTNPVDGFGLTIGLPAPAELDDFAACGITRAEQIRDLFVPNFCFGCEPDDPTGAWAFNTRFNAYGARLNAMFSSDISHFDVVDMREVLPEAWELREKELLTQEDFRDFMFTNAARFLTRTNPDFFAGTVVERQVTQALDGNGAQA